MKSIGRLGAGVGTIESNLLHSIGGLGDATKLWAIIGAIESKLWRFGTVLESLGSASVQPKSPCSRLKVWGERPLPPDYEDNLEISLYRAAENVGEGIV